MSACAPLLAVARPLTRADRSDVAVAVLAGAAQQLGDLAADLEADPDLELPAELQRSGIGPLQLHGAARYLLARAQLYGGNDDLALERVGFPL